jgi:5-methylcytosine-specific restriction endonuclease McrA
MPIKPENRKRYPANWKQIRAEILERAGHCREGSPKYPDCRVANYSSHPETGSKVVLTIGHLDHTPENCAPENLKAWCQRCHLTYDHQHHLENSARTRRKKAKQIDLVDGLQAQ